jgi:endonuclease/exonuclease/phosphatase (EEP) superfamily protein YafD
MMAISVALTALSFGLLSLGRIEHNKGDAALLVASFNLNLDNQQAPGLDAWVHSSKPDVLALFELTSQHAPLIERLKTSLPHAVMQMQDDPFGVAILSKMPLDGAEVKSHMESTPFIEASLKVHGRPILIRAIHPMPPISGRDRQTRDSLINAVSRVNGEPLVVLGDFNASPWTPVMRALADKGLKRATTLMPTQNLYGGLPIDHVLASDAHWYVLDAGVGGNHGSDHNLVWAHLTAR